MEPGHICLLLLDSRSNKSHIINNDQMIKKSSIHAFFYKFLIIKNNKTEKEHIHNVFKSNTKKTSTTTIQYYIKQENILSTPNNFKTHTPLHYLYQQQYNTVNISCKKKYQPHFE